MTRVQAIACAVCAEPMRRGPGSLPQGEAMCLPCRKDGRSWTHGTTYAYRKGCRCEECKAEKNRSMREYNAKIKQRDGASATAQFKRRKAGRGAAPKCFVCKKPLVLSRAKHTRYPLHKTCRQSAPTWIRKGLDNPRRASFQAKIERAAQGTSGGGRIWTAGNCSWCGVSFVGLSHYCSQSCRRSAKFAARAGVDVFAISKKARLAIYDRDGWLCQICHAPVDPDAHHLDDWYPTLDHIIPQSAMLIPDHSETNLRTCHRICNAYRSDAKWLTDEDVREIANKRLALIA